MEEKLIKILEEKYEPILVMYLMQIPEDRDYLSKLSKEIYKQFKYKVLIMPGTLENKVELISILNIDETTIENLQNQVFKLIEDLKAEAQEQK